MNEPAGFSDEAKARREDDPDVGGGDLPTGFEAAGSAAARDDRNSAGDRQPIVAKEQKHDAREAQKDEAPSPPPKKAYAIVLLVLIGVLGWGGYSHWRQYDESRRTTADILNRPVEVRTVEAKREDGPISLTLPGQTNAFDSATIYARATGYISERKADIGTRVKKGDDLVKISAPDLDQQLAQAIAQLDQTRATLTQAQAQVPQAQANLALARVNLGRTDKLAVQGFETQQNKDTQQANLLVQQANLDAVKAAVNVAEANIKAQQATINRLKALTEFEEVRAPFDGIVTQRNVDVGDLVNADASTGSPMFALARDDVLRVTVQIPQSAATGVRNGLEAEIRVQQIPGKTFKGKVARSSGALLYASRTLNTEVDIPNPDGELRAGLYVMVTFNVPREKPDVVLPAEALIFNQSGMQVAAVEGDQVIKMHTVSIYRDHGKTVEIREGLNGTENIVVSPPAGLRDGSKVKTAPPGGEPKPDEPPGGATKQAMRGSQQ